MCFIFVEMKSSNFKLPDMEAKNFVVADDWSTINVKDAWQVLFWCNTLGISKTEFEKAVDQVGNDVSKVRQLFGK